MKILQANVQSINTSKLLMEMVIQRHQPDILLLQEVWCPKEIPVFRDFLPPLVKIRNDKQGGGVAIYTHKKVKCVPLSKYDIDGVEAVWAEVMSGNTRITLGSAYIPPGEFQQLKRFGEQLVRVCNENEQVLIGMDSNGRHPLWDNHVTQNQYAANRRMGDLLVDILQDCQLFVLNDGTSTCHSSSCSSALDVTACKVDKPTSWNVIDNDIRSDHSAIIIQIGRVAGRQREVVADWKNLDWTEYERQSESALAELITKWTQSDLDCRTMNQQITEVLTGLTEKLVPTKVVCEHSKPWFTKELAEQLKRQRQVKKMWRRRRTPRNSAEYHKVLKRTEEMITEAKQNWWEKEVNKLKTASQAEKWKIISRVTNSDMKMGIQPVEMHGKYVFQDSEILNAMEEYHVKSDGSRVTEDDRVNAEVRSLMERRKDIKDYDVMNVAITNEEIRSTFGLCSDTPGPDGISARMIDKASRDQMILCLSHLWNKVWTDGTLPPEWKLEHRMLIPKPGKENYNTCNAYRTVSVTDVLGKRLEKVVVKRLVCAMNGNDCRLPDFSTFDENQFAYLRSRSSTQAVLSLAEIAKGNVLNSQYTGVIFFDFADAFGTVNRKKLLLKLGQDFGVSGKLMTYIYDFLSGRYARLKVNDLIGEWISSEYGTSAGTVLGAILFIAYVHDTPNSIHPKFADDMVSYVTGKDVASVESELQASIDELVAWASRWDMKLNIEKTKVMLIGGRSQDRLNLSASGICIEQVSTFKYLGIMLDDQLNFDAQVEYAATKARKAFSKVSRLINGRKGISVRLGLELYKTLVRPHLEFSVPAWATMSEKGLQQLEKVQSDCLRRILGAKSHSSSDAMEVISNIMPVRLRIQELCVREFVRIQRKPDDSKIRSLLTSSTVRRGRFTPMSYIKHVARGFQRLLGNLEIEMEHEITPEQILDEVTVKLIPLARDVGNARTRSAEQSAQGKSAVDEFVQAHRDSSVMIFTDGAVEDDGLGLGSCAAVLVPIGIDEGETVATEAFSILTDSTEAEVCGIALALDIAIQHYTILVPEEKQDNLYILSDCRAAIDIVINRQQVDHHIHVLTRIRNHLRTLCDMNVEVTLVWIPGHCNIYYNDLADLNAKNSIEDAYDISKVPQLTPHTCKRMITKQCNSAWQTRWERSAVARSTYDLIPTVGRRLLFPDDRCCAVSYARLLLDDTLLKVHQLRYGFDVSRECECGHGIDDAHHFFLECERYGHQRKLLIDDIAAIWENSNNKACFSPSVSFLLAPYNNGNLTQQEIYDISLAVFRFIGHSSRCL